MPDPRDGAGGSNWRETIAAFCDKIPLFGPPVAVILRAEAGVRRAIVALVAILLVYPILSLLIALSILVRVPGGYGTTALLLAGDYKTLHKKLMSEEYNTIDSSNKALDGSVLMTFSLDDPPGKVYRYDFVPGQEIRLATYQIEAPAKILPDATLCGAHSPTSIADLPKQSQPPGAPPIAAGTLQVKEAGFANGFDFPVPLSFGGNEEFLPAIRSTKGEIWTRLHENPSAADTDHPIAIEFTFEPSGEVRNAANGCERFDVYIVMTYSKRMLESSK